MGNDLPAQSARPTGLRGHGHERCDSDPRVLFGGRRADKPLKGPVSPSSKVYQLLPGYTSPTTTTIITTVATAISGETLPPRRSICIQTTLDFVPVHFARPNCALLHVDKHPFYIPALGVEEIIV